MRLHGAVLVASTAVLVAACASSSSQVESPGAIVPSPSTMRWTTSLEPMNGSGITGTATVLAGDNPNQTRVDLVINGAQAGGIYPWHVHLGSCGNDQGIVGPANAYPPVAVGADGMGRVLATIPTGLDRSGQYMVNVHKSPQDLGTIVACGNLAL
jgi:hypothetical protein